MTTPEMITAKTMNECPSCIPGCADLAIATTPNISQRLGCWTNSSDSSKLAGSASDGGRSRRHRAPSRRTPRPRPVRRRPLRRASRLTARWRRFLVIDPSLVRVATLGTPRPGLAWPIQCRVAAPGGRRISVRNARNLVPWPLARTSIRSPCCSRSDPAWSSAAAPLRFPRSPGSSRRAPMSPCSHRMS